VAIPPLGLAKVSYNFVIGMLIFLSYLILIRAMILNSFIPVIRCT